MQSSFNLIFDPSEDAAIHWAARTSLEHALDLRKAEQLYARAIPYMKTWAWALTTKHGWKEEAVDTVGDMPLAFCLGRDELMHGPDGDFSYVARLVLPLNFSDLLNSEFTNDWAAMFSHLMTPQQPDSADIFQLGRAGIPRPLQNILYLLQILSPGLLLVRSTSTDEDEEDPEWANQGIDLVALPPSIWVGLHIEDLEDIFGAQTAVKLYQAAEDPYCSSEDATSISNYGSQDASDMYFDDSSYSGFASDNSDEDWPGSDVPDYEEDDVLLQFSQPYPPAKDIYDYSEVSVLPDYGHEEYKPAPEHHLISDFDNGKAQNLMEYRHCDSDCAFCGTCSSRFAESLTERLLMHGALLTI
jgi:hypothetical protein